MLREFEEKAAQVEPEDATAFLKVVAQGITRAMASAFEAQRRSVPEQLAEEAGRTLVGLVPFYGALATGAASLEAIPTDALAQRKSWMASLMILMKNS